MSTLQTIPELREAALDPNYHTIKALAETLRKEEQVNMPLRHMFAPGIYVRMIYMPKGTFVIGHEHKTVHFNMVLAGRATVMMNGVEAEIKAPDMFISGAGVQKVLTIHENMLWATVHANPTNETDIATLERGLIELDPERWAEMAGRTVDEFRMSVNQLPAPSPFNLSTLCQSLSLES